MPDYMVKYLAHIDMRKKPEGFPVEVSAVGTYRAENHVALAEVINQEIAVILTNQGMMVQLDPTTVIETGKLNTKNRCFVPMHMITHLEIDVKKMATMPKVNDTGILSADGKPVVEYLDEDGKKLLPS